MNNIPFDLKQQLNTKGYKLTPQREAILGVVSMHKGKHLSCEEIFDLVSKSYSGIGLATIYRTLPILEKMELLNKIHLEDGCVRYELNDSDQKHSHHHLICLVCGSVFEVQEDMLENLEKQIYEKNKFIIKNHSVKFYGKCEECSKV